jgi:hypothetical protein
MLADFDGNALDACCLAAVGLGVLLGMFSHFLLLLHLHFNAQVAALRAFRRPEVSVHTLLSEDAMLAPRSVAPSVPAYAHVASGPQSVVAVRVHPAAEREPLPLALHHTPTNATLAVFKVICAFV